MKNPVSTFLTIAAVLIFALAASSQSTYRLRSDAKFTAGVTAILESQAAAWNRGDIDGYMAGYANSPDTEFVAGDTITRGWQPVRDRYKTRYDSREKMGTLSFTDIEVNAIGSDSALVTGHWELKRAGDNPHGRFTLLFRRLAEGWRIVHDHSSSAT